MTKAPTRKGQEPSLPSVSNGMTESEAMQILINLKASQRAKGELGTQLNVAAAPPRPSETSHEGLKRENPGLTSAEINELAALHGA